MKKEAHGNMSGSKLTGSEISTYFRKNPKAKRVRKAVEFALDHGGAMSYAIKKIEKMKRGLSKHPEVKKALDYANFGESVARDLFKSIVTENYTKNFQNLVVALKFNPVQQKILEDFISTGLVENQYIGRVAGTKKETKTYAASRKYKGSNENVRESLMKALKVNEQQQKILNKYLNTGKVIGKYTGSIAGTRKTTKSYAGYQGFTEQTYPILFDELNEARKPKADGREFKWNRENHPPLSDDTVEIDLEMVNWDDKGETDGDKKYNVKSVSKRFKLKFRRSGDTWLAKGKSEDVFYYITTEYDGNSASGKDKPNSMDVEQITEFWPEIYDFYAQEDVQERFNDRVPSGKKTKHFEIRCSTKDAPKIVKLAEVYAKKNKFKFQAIKDEEMGLTGMSSSTDIFAHNIDYDPEAKEPSYQAWVVISVNEKSKRYDEADLNDVYKKSQKLGSAMSKAMYAEDLEEGWLDVKKIQVKYRKEIKYLKKNSSASGSKKEQELLDAISSILSNKENGRWKDPDWADMKALELIWDDEWDRLK